MLTLQLAAGGLGPVFGSCVTQIRSDLFVKRQASSEALQAVVVSLNKTTVLVKRMQSFGAGFTP